MKAEEYLCAREAERAIQRENATRARAKAAREHAAKVAGLYSHQAKFRAQWAALRDRKTRRAAAAREEEA